MEYLIGLLIGYFIGSFPTAFIILKKYKEIDITAAGTGNVGAMNSFEVTRSKAVGIIVFLIDFFKGMLSIIILFLFSISEFSVHAAALIGCIFSHCYNPWLKLKGGRGLASAAGGTAIIFPFILIVWVILWVIFYFMKKDITIANVLASIMGLLITFTSIKIGVKYAFPVPESEAVLILFTLGLFITILSKHTEPLQELFETLKTSKGNNK